MVSVGGGPPHTQPPVAGLIAVPNLSFHTGPSGLRVETKGNLATGCPPPFLPSPQG